MTTIIKYRCDICKKMYETPSDAIDCESKGIFDGIKYPQGLMFENHHHGFVGIFSIPKTIEPNKGGYSGGHIGCTSYWACRANNRVGDSLGEELCGGDYICSDYDSVKQWIKYHHITEEKLESPEYKRMVEYLKSVNITPSYYTKEGKLITV